MSTWVLPSERAKKERLEKDAASVFSESNEAYVAPYTKLERGYGNADCRIGTHLTLNDDIYSLAFSC